MKIVKLTAIPMSASVPEEKRHRIDLGTKVKSDATLIRVEADNDLSGNAHAPQSAIPQLNFVPVMLNPSRSTHSGSVRRHQQYGLPR